VDVKVAVFPAVPVVEFAALVERDLLGPTLYQCLWPDTETYAFGTLRQLSVPLPGREPTRSPEDDGAREEVAYGRMLIHSGAFGVGTGGWPPVTSQ
jgi:hypothetical protein